MKLTKNLVLSLFDKIHLNEGGTLTQMWITNGNMHYLMRISLRGVQEGRVENVLAASTCYVDCQARGYDLFAFPSLKD